MVLQCLSHWPRGWRGGAATQVSIRAWAVWIRDGALSHGASSSSHVPCMLFPGVWLVIMPTQPPPIEHTAPHTVPARVPCSRPTPRRPVTHTRGRAAA
eukprot:1775131-Prymnesium_polylepis.1